MSEPIADFMLRYQQRVNDCLQQWFANADVPAPGLHEAMWYSLFGPGKRVRPLLAYAAAKAVGAVNPAVDAVACALECIHTYSLIHDDLPAMDDDELRRGRPTCHIQFNEATAILAGDALQTAAFDMLTQLNGVSPTTALRLVSELAKASGAAGMVAGQAVDLAAVQQQLALAELERMHRLKTGALIRASVIMGALATEAASSEQLQALRDYADAVGLAFQVQDDILDVCGDTNALGKPQGADARLNKPTYVSLLGIDEARRKAGQLHRDALAALTDFNEHAEPLRALSSYIVARDR